MKKMEKIPIKIKRTSGYEDLPLPTYMTEGAVGMDLYAAVDRPLEIKPGDWAAVSVGFSMALPLGFEAQIRPRSGLALGHGISLMNSPGTIDADYRGEVRVIIVNHGKKTFVIKRADRIAQMTIQRAYLGSFELVEDLSETSRGEGGFGHTGI